MPIFPPLPRYPVAYDDDYSLFLVYNTSQSYLSIDNQAWTDTIDIITSDVEIWADNGFLNLSDEFIYYDGVERDISGKVIRFKRCLRGINGFSQFNPAGTLIRGTVVAEHHNQMSLAIQKTERFVGYTNDPNTITLDWRIRNLFAEDRIADDFACPEIQFDFNIEEQSRSTGVLISYSVTITGTYGSAIISFGDGTKTTNLTGTHRYPINAKIDPSVTVTNGNCQIVQTPIERDQVEAPQPEAATPPFTIPVPVAPTFPDLVFPSIVFPSFDLLPPPFIDSCLDLTPLQNLPSIFGDFLSIIPSLIIPSFITSGAISIVVPPGTTIPIDGAGVSIPLIIPSSAVISIGPFPPAPTISFGPSPLPVSIPFGPNPLPSQISIVPGPGFPSEISVNWGTPPSLVCTCVVVCPSATPMAMAGGINDPVPDAVEINYDFAGIPSSIKIMPPEEPIRFENNLPSLIKIESQPIEIIGMDFIPREIQVVMPEPEKMVIRLEVPEISPIKVEGFPSLIPVVFPDEMPLIRFDTSTIPSEIRVVGIPDVIKIENTIPSRIEVGWSDTIMSIPPLKVEPVEVKINFSFDRLSSADNNYEAQCFALIPCSKK